MVPALTWEGNGDTILLHHVELLLQKRDGRVQTRYRRVVEIKPILQRVDVILYIDAQKRR
jgi:hypothetical protein